MVKKQLTWLNKFHNKILLDCLIEQEANLDIMIKYLGNKNVKDKTLEGKKCYLSPTIMDDVYQYAEWFNDIEVTKYLASPLSIVNLANEAQYLEQ